MCKADIYAISPPFYALDKKWGFQYVKPVFRLYGVDGAFVKEFRNFEAMNRFIIDNLFTEG